MKDSNLGALGGSNGVKGIDFCGEGALLAWVFLYH